MAEHSYAHTVVTRRDTTGIPLPPVRVECFALRGGELGSIVWPCRMIFLYRRQPSAAPGRAPTATGIFLAAPVMSLLTTPPATPRKTHRCRASRPDWHTFWTVLVDHAYDDGVGIPLRDTCTCCTRTNARRSAARISEAAAAARTLVRAAAGSISPTMHHANVLEPVGSAAPIRFAVA